jgi:transposase
VKSDREDARKLGDLDRAGYLETVWYPDEDTLRLRHFISDRASLVKYKTMLKNQVHSVLDRNLIRHSHSDLFGGEGREWLALLIERKDTDCYERDRLRFLVAEIGRQELLTDDLDRTIAAFISSRPAMRRNLDLLLSIPGVSLAVGATVLAATGDVTRFPTKRKFACYFGLTQRIKQTGGHEPRVGRISKQGNAYARFMLVEAAEHFRKASPVYRRLFERISKKRGRNVAIIAVARRLAEVIWAILTRQEEFVFTSPRLTMEKQARVSKAASDKANLKLPRRETNQIIRGTNLRGRDIKEEIYRRASDKAAGILDLMEMGKRLEEASPTGFNPRRPTHADWHKVLELVATEYVRELALAKAA